MLIFIANVENGVKAEVSDSVNLLYASVNFIKIKLF
jgi:hypothetical protein